MTIDNTAGLPDELNITITAEDILDTHDILSRSNTSHCFRCLAPKPEPQPRGWGGLLLESFTRGKYFVFSCPDCLPAVEEWLCGEDDPSLGHIDDLDIR